MSFLIGIVGEPGTGKTTAMRNLEPSTTYMVNCTNKPLPFRNSTRLYSVDKKNYFSSSNYNEVLQRIRTIDTKATHIKTLILDDLGFVMSDEFFARSAESGY